VLGDFIGQNEAPFCRLAHIADPGIHDVFADARGTKGTPIVASARVFTAATIRKPPAANDLRGRGEFERRQNAKSLERQSHLSPEVGDAGDKMESRKVATQPAGTTDYRAAS
jgi:hypothetical protein